MTPAAMTQVRNALIGALTLALPLAACEPKAPEPQKVAAKPPVAKTRRCPDPDIRDAKNPCSVAYIQRTPGRLSERDLH
ncbi:hypothetical protein [Caulobacter soli]|uniref:hypothetical protein n=1 Tax=Caulobacter soli TaxID=2708539 RepID=UPI0013ED6520|nr:hypothetical protein [Caulobacter soli]